MTKEEFVFYVGHEPDQDDLARANCEEAGSIGHLGCGVCVHHVPVFLCKECFDERLKLCDKA